MPAVHGAVDDGGDPLLRVVFDDGIFKHGFPRSWFSDEDAESSLLGVNFEEVKVALLVSKEGGVRIDNEGISSESKVGS